MGKWLRENGLADVASHTSSVRWSELSIAIMTQLLLINKAIRTGIVWR
jgi:hypothetical protein